MDSIIVDIKTFQKDTALPQDMLKELYLCFVDEMRNYKQQIDNNLMTPNKEQLKRVIHNIKGVAANYHSLGVFEITEKVYLKLKNNTVDGLTQDLLDLEEAIDQAIAFILEYFK